MNHEADFGHPTDPYLAFGDILSPGTVRPVKLWMIDAPQFSGTKADGWFSSRSMQTVVLAARTYSNAAARLAAYTWYAQGGDWVIRHMYAQVTEVDPATGDLIGDTVWCRLTKQHGGTYGVYGATYAEVKCHVA